MNQPRRIALGLMIVAFGSLAATLSSNQPPTRYTNAPGENNCTSCHSGSLNNGPGNVSLSGISTYTPGNTYTLTVSVTDNTKSRFGFSLTSLRSTNQGGGTLAVTNSTNTSLQNGTVSGITRQYLGHKNATSNNNWSFSWTAPPTNVGAVTFFISANATNNNGNTSGDNVYSQTFVVNPAPTPPVAGFTSSAASACLNQNITFTNTSTGSISTYSWNFGAGASPATASTAGPHTITYGSPGAKTVRLIVSGAGGADTSEMAVTINALPVVTLGGLDPSYCSNEGAILLQGMPAGGTFTGSGVTDSLFSPTAAGTGQKIISYTYTDLNGCAASAADTTTVLAAPAVTVTPPGPYNLCPGDSITLDAGAGFATYDWSDGSTAQTTTLSTAGIYEVIVHASNGCADTSGLLLLNSYPDPVVNIQVSGDTSFCAGDSAVLDAGAGFATYLWTDGSAGRTLTATSSGNFNVTVTDNNGCSDSADHPVQIVVIPGPPVPGVTPSADSLEICEGDTLVLVADTGFLSYQWPTGEFGATLSAATPGFYYVIVSDSNGCTNRSVPQWITVHSLPNPHIVIYNQDTLSAEPFAVYQWAFYDSVSGVTTPIPGADSRLFPSADYRNDPGFTGMVIVTVTDSNGCMNSADPFPVPAATAIGRDEFLFSFQVFPNPVSDLLWVTWENNQPEGVSIALRDLNGRLLQSASGKVNKLTLNTEALPQGIYLLEITRGGERIYRKIERR